jgi:hypothetical protein
MGCGPVQDGLGRVARSRDDGLMFVVLNHLSGLNHAPGGARDQPIEDCSGRAGCAWLHVAAMDSNRF